MNVATRIRAGALLEADPLDFFNGRVDAHGFFADWTGTVKRRFTANFLGAAAGDQIAIDEVLVYDDAQVDRRTWALARSAEGQWQGTATDVAGSILIDRISPAQTRWRYAMNIPVGGRTIRFSLEDTMVQTAPDQWVSTTSVRKLGLTVGRIICSYHRHGG